jgi:hypothetical protein
MNMRPLSRWRPDCNQSHDPNPTRGFVDVRIGIPGPATPVHRLAPDPTRSAAMRAHSRADVCGRVGSSQNHQAQTATSSVKSPSGTAATRGPGRRRVPLSPRGPPRRAPSWSGPRCSRDPSARRRSRHRPGTARAGSPGWLLTRIDRTCPPACHAEPTRPVTGSRHDKLLFAGPPPPSEGVGSRRRQPAPPRYAEKPLRRFSTDLFNLYQLE